MIGSSGMLATLSQNAKDNGFDLGASQYPTYDAEKPVAMIGGRKRLHHLRGQY